MGGSSGGGSVSTASGIPPWARKYHQELLKNTQSHVYNQGNGAGFDAVRYDQNDRISGLSPGEMAGVQARGDMFNAGDPYGAAAAASMGQAADTMAGTGDVGSDYQNQQFDFGKFGAQQQAEYMSPYQQAVVDEELRAASEEYQQQMNRTDADRVSSGSRGGYRDALDNLLGGQLQAQTMGGIQARGSQAAFENAQQQFERDRGAQIRAAEMGDASSQFGAQQWLQADLANQAFGKDKASFYSDLGMRSSDLGNSSQQRELARIGAMEEGGERLRKLEQARMDLAYEEFMREANYPKEQMNFMASMLAGVPNQQSIVKPGQSAASNLIGAGLGAAGIANLVKQGQS